MVWPKMVGNANPDTEWETEWRLRIPPPSLGGVAPCEKATLGCNQDAVWGRAPTLRSSPAGSLSPRSTGRASTRWCPKVCWASCAAPAGRRARRGCAGAAVRSGPSASWCPRVPVPHRAARMSRPRAKLPPCWVAVPTPGAHAGTRGPRALNTEALFAWAGDGVGRRNGRWTSGGIEEVKNVDYGTSTSPASWNHSSASHLTPPFFQDCPSL